MELTGQARHAVKHMDIAASKVYDVARERVLTCTQLPFTDTATHIGYIFCMLSMKLQVCWTSNYELM